MTDDIVLFYYYSSPSPPEGCWLGMSADVAYRNMFLLPCGDRVHFEFPMFEDHSYNTICNRLGLRKLIQRPSVNAKYIIFRTGGQDIVGFYRIKRAYYQETRMFNNNGYVWGIEAEPHLIKRGRIKYEGPRLRQGFQASWHVGWSHRLKNLLLCIGEEEDISNQYQAETNRLISLLKNPEETTRWQRECEVCELKLDCELQIQFSKYQRLHPGSTMFSALSGVYNGNIYSQNVLGGIPKTYLI